jgi:hypothetical protein
MRLIESSLASRDSMSASEKKISIAFRSALKYSWDNDVIWNESRWSFFCAQLYFGAADPNLWICILLIFLKRDASLWINKQLFKNQTLHTPMCFAQHFYRALIFENLISSNRSLEIVYHHAYLNPFLSVSQINTLIFYCYISEIHIHKILIVKRSSFSPALWHALNFILH